MARMSRNLEQRRHLGRFFFAVHVGRTGDAHEIVCGPMHASYDNAAAATTHMDTQQRPSAAATRGSVWRPRPGSGALDIDQRPQAVHNVHKQCSVGHHLHRSGHHTAGSDTRSCSPALPMAGQCMQQLQHLAAPMRGGTDLNPHLRQVFVGLGGLVAHAAVRVAHDALHGPLKRLVRSSTLSLACGPPASPNIMLRLPATCIP